MAEPVALAALALDATIGWPARLYAVVGHPVGAIAKLIAIGERWGNRPRFAFAWRRAAGVVTMIVTVGVTIVAGLALSRLAHLVLGRWAWIGIAILAWPALAQRSLDDHVRPVAAALAAGDLVTARQRVAAVVGRDTTMLDATGVARAAIETLAESFCDGIVAPLGWLLAGGLPGVWAYKAANTADSLIGHHEPRWRAFGWAAARLDDLLTLLPARAAGALLCLAGGGGWRTMVRDHARHASPNGGWPEAAMAGLLGVRLGGPVAYDGIAADRPWINVGGRQPDAADLRRALAIYRRACLLLWITAGGIAWLR